MVMDPYRLAVRYYFGELGYWELPKIAQDALEQGYDGPSLRRLAGLTSPVASDISREEIDAAFKEMGVAAPMARDRTRLVLAAESASQALHGQFNVFDAATHIRIYLCGLEEPPPELRRIVSLSEQARHAPQTTWENLEAELRDAMADFLRNHE